MLSHPTTNSSDITDSEPWPVAKKYWKGSTLSRKNHYFGENKVHYHKYFQGILVLQFTLEEWNRNEFPVQHEN